MLIGHFAPALVLQRTRASVPLWILFVATQAVDVLWALFILTGVEHARIVHGFTASNSLDLYDMPYSHSLAAAAVWAVLFASLWRVSRPRGRDGALLIGLAVASHFVLDLVVHVPDLPVATRHGTLWGLGLWRHRELALLVEAALFVAAALFWRQAPENRGRRGAIVLAGMTVFLVASYYLPTMPTPASMAVTGLAIYAACAFAAWWAGSNVNRPTRLRRSMS